MELSRRQILQKLLAGAAASALPLALGKDSSALPRPDKSGIEHVVVVTMENRSFDHFLGWLPGADGKQASLTYYDAANLPHQTYHLTDYQGCGHSDPDHSAEGGLIEYNNGACDGWLRAGQNDLFSIGYYTQADLAFLGKAAPQWVTCDRFFSAIMAETFPNRFYTHAAQTDRLTNTFDISVLPTIWDQLQLHGVKGRYYYSDVPFLALWGAKYLPISLPIQSFFTDAARGTLPQVSFVDPRFLGAAEGLSGDDHPFADIRNGEAFLSLIYRAVTASPNWEKTVLVIHYDEWGGFFDHVPPSTAADVDPNHQLRGFRVPALIISPWSARGEVEHGVYDHSSILKMIEWRWDLPALTIRDASSNNLAEVLDFKAKAKKVTAPDYGVPLGPFGGMCNVPLQGALGGEAEQLLALARAYGWPS